MNSTKIATNTDLLTAVQSRTARWDDWIELTKPRLSMLSVMTALMGYLAAAPTITLNGLMALLAGTSLAAGGAASLNMWLERDADARMQRTSGRPLPQGLIRPVDAMALGLVLSITGTTLLWLGCNPLAGMLAGLTVATYLLAYTPLKRITPWATEVGAVPGAIPPLLGWAAATGSTGLTGWYLFAILFAWQVPHFMAIAWKHRKDYVRGGFRLLSPTDIEGKGAARRSVFFAAILVMLAIYPLAIGEGGWLFALVGPLLALGYLWRAIQFWRAELRDAPAKKLFLASIMFLPLYLIAFVADRYL